MRGRVSIDRMPLASFGEGESALKGGSSQELIRPSVEGHFAVAARNRVMREIQRWFESHGNRQRLHPARNPTDGSRGSTAQVVFVDQYDQAAWICPDLYRRRAVPVAKRPAYWIGPWATRQRACIGLSYRNTSL